jgi:DNA-binding IclR family transcriptional regulator
VLAQALARIRQQGYAITRGERTPGAVGIAAPISGASGACIGSVGITLPEQRFRAEDERQQSEHVRAAARAISQQLHGIPGERP